MPLTALCTRSERDRLDQLGEHKFRSSGRRSPCGRSTYVDRPARSLAGAQDHHEVVPVTRETRPHVLVVVASPDEVTPGCVVGFWARELTHPDYEFSKARYRVTVARPHGCGSRA